MTTPSSSPPQRLATGEPATAAIAAPGEVTFILEAGRADRNYWADLWRFRELFAILAWRDVAVQYKQTVIGIAWALVRPLLTTLIFTGLFSRIARLPSEGATPYPLMVMAGMLPWFLFSTILTSASGSLTSNSNLISKVYFPRLIIPASAVITSMVDFLITFVLLLIMFVFFQYTPSVRILFLPFFVLLAFFCAFGIGLYITALNVKYRDFRYIIPFVIQFGLYITPVGFSTQVLLSKLPPFFQSVYMLNPMVGVIDGFRWCFFENTPLSINTLLYSIGMTTLFMYIGVRTFRKMERHFADLI